MATRRPPNNLIDIVTVDFIFFLWVSVFLTIMGFRLMKDSLVTRIYMSAITVSLMTIR